MAKKSPVSSQPEKLVRMKADDIFSKPQTKQQQATLKSLANRFLRYPGTHGRTTGAMVPFRFRSKTTLISFRVQNDVLSWLKLKGPGHKPNQRDLSECHASRTAPEKLLSVSPVGATSGPVCSLRRRPAILFTVTGKEEPKGPRRIHPIIVVHNWVGLLPKMI